MPVRKTKRCDSYTLTIAGKVFMADICNEDYASPLKVMACDMVEPGSWIWRTATDAEWSAVRGAIFSAVEDGSLVDETTPEWYSDVMANA